MFLTLEDRTFHVAEDGVPQSPVVVLLHSLGTSSHVWDAQARNLAADHYVIRPDFRGHGLSELSPSPLTIELMAQDVLALLDRMQVREFSLAGISIGGMVAQALAARARERVTRLALFDTSMASLDPAMWRARAAKVRAEGLGAIADGVLARWTTPAFAGSPGARGLRRMLDRTPPESYAQGCDALALANCSATTPSLRLPCHVAVGAEDEATPPSAAKALAAAVPGARLTLITGAAHIPPVERPDHVTTILRDTLDQHGRLAPRTSGAISEMGGER